MENSRIREYINNLFQDAPQTKKAVELKEEIIQNLNDKYNDLISEGKSEEAAYNISAASVGDINELIGSLKDSAEQSPQVMEQLRESKKRSAIIMSIAIGLYILCVAPLIALDAVGLDTLGVIIMFVMIAVATGLIIYNNMTKPKMPENEDTVVEEFKKWQNENSDKYAIYKAVSSAVTAIGTVLYFVISFATGAWHITWLTFIIVAAINNVLKSVFQLVK